MDYKRTDLLRWLISVLVSTITASVFGQNQAATAAPAIEPAPSASATATDAAAKKTEAHQTLAYTNAVINYCNRINSFLLTVQNLDREIQRALQGEVAAKKYLAPPLFSVSALNVDTEYYKTNAETVPDSLTEADRAFFVNQVQSLKETQSRVKEDVITLVGYILDNQSATDGGAKGQQLVQDERAGMNDLAEQRDITAKRAQTLGQMSEVLTMQGDPRREKVYAMQEDLQNVKELISFFSSHGAWKRGDADNILDATNKLKESLDRHTQLYIQDKTGFPAIFLKAGNRLLEEVTQIYDQVRAEGAPRPSPLRFLAGEYSSMVSEYNFAISP
jgi:hypothetical protein